MLFGALSAANEFSQLHTHAWQWGLLLGWYAFLLLVDLFIIHRKDKEISLPSAMRQTIGWITLGVGMGVLFWIVFGRQAGSEYFSGYLLEKSLSIDNVFAWSVIMSYYAIPKQYQHRVLFWGIFGALTMRAAFIFAGIALIDRFEAVLLLFGAILLYSGIGLMVAKDDQEFKPGESRFLNWAQRHLPLSHTLDGHRFFTKKNGKRVGTLLLIALIAIELTDVIFAVDSVPAILGVARDPMIVFAATASAILGMRSIYFVFEGIKDRFWLLNKALGLLLVTIGIKMVVSPSSVFGLPWLGIHIPTWLSLGSIAVIITAGVAGSLLIKQPRRS